MMHINTYTHTHTHTLHVQLQYIICISVRTVYIILINNTRTIITVHTDPMVNTVCVTAEPLCVCEREPKALSSLLCQPNDTVSWLKQSGLMQSFSDFARALVHTTSYNCMLFLVRWPNVYAHVHISGALACDLYTRCAMQFALLSMLRRFFEKNGRFSQDSNPFHCISSQ